jgi:hypothetical protein
MTSSFRPDRSMISSSRPDRYPRCRKCSSKMEMVLKEDLKYERVGRYFVCPQHCGAASTPGSQEIPDCPWCSKPMTLHVGRFGEWKGVPIWYCKVDRHPRSDGALRSRPSKPHQSPEQQNPSEPPRVFKGHPRPTPQPQAPPENPWASLSRKLARNNPPPKNVRRVVPPPEEPLGKRPVDPGTAFKRGDGTQ